MQAGDNDNEPLEPHAQQHDQRHAKQQRHAASSPLRPQHLWHHHIAGQQQPVAPRVRTSHAVVSHVLFVRIAAIPGHECFHRVAVSNDQQVASITFAMFCRC